MTTKPLCFEFLWGHFPATATYPDAKRWIESCVMLGLATNTVIAYAGV